MFTLRRCPTCNAFRDASEKDLCCLKGKRIVTPEMFPPWDSDFQEVVQRHANVLVSHSREINNDLCFTSIGSEHAEQRASGFVWRVDAKGPPTMYGLYGRVFHRYRDRQKEGSYLQVFHSTSAYPDCGPACDDFKRYLTIHNVLAQGYQSLSDMQHSSSLDHHAVRLHPNDEPSCPQEPFILLRQDYENFSNNARVTCLIWSSDDKPMYIDSTSVLYDPGQYPLLFPSGRGGYFDARQSGKSYFSTAQGIPQTCKGVLEYSKYVLYQRADTLSLFPTLTQQYILDQYSRWQSITLSKMAADRSVVNGMQRRIKKFKERGTRGRPYMLPASIPGSPMYQRNLVDDGMAVIGRYGNPTLFITFTGNPAWPEFLEAVRITTGKDPPPDAHVLFPALLVRVFKAKLYALENDLKVGSIFVHRQVFIQRVIEFQKRYIPHAHIVIRLDAPDPTPNMVDSWITTRMFYHEECPQFSGDIDSCIRAKCDCPAHILNRFIFSKMRHTKCTEGKCLTPTGCKKGYPFDHAGEPTMSHSWCNSRGTWTLRRSFRQDSKVVPYNRRLVEKYNAHINVECCASFTVIRYLRKYLSKMPDTSRALPSLDAVLANPKLEFQLWQSYRHVGVAEAVVRLLQIDINLAEPAVSRVYIHKEGEHNIFGSDETDVQGDNSRISPLLRYFCRHIKLRSLKYSEYYEQYTKRESHTEFPDDPSPYGSHPIWYWGHRAREHICRIVTPPTYRDPELLALHLILLSFARCSFKDCRTVDGHLYDTYHEAAENLGLLTHNDHVLVLQEVINPDPRAWQVFHKSTDQTIKPHMLGTPAKVRIVFTMLLISGAPASDMFRYPYTHYMALDNLECGVSDNTFILREVRKLLWEERMSLTDVGLPDIVDTMQPVPDLIASEKSRYTVNQPDAEICLSTEQRGVYETVTKNFKSSSNQFLLRACAGSGKTVVARKIVRDLRREDHLVLVCAPTAKAAGQYVGAFTCHKLFGIPTKQGGALYHNDERHPLTQLILKCSLIVVDELSMLLQCNLHTIDLYLRDVCKIDKPFGGRCMLFIGDFAQLPPVVKGRNDEASTISNSCISSPLLRHMTQMTLTEVPRSVSPPFTQWLSRLSRGFDMNGFSDVRLPDTIRRYSTSDDALKDYLNQALPNRFPSNDILELASVTLYKSYIVAFTNARVDYYNEAVSQHIIKKYNLPTHTCVAQHEATHTPGNLVNLDMMMKYKDTTSSLPHPTLILFRGAIVMLTRNFMASRGLVNGAVFIVDAVLKNTVHVINISGSRESNPFYGSHDILFRFTFPVDEFGIKFTRKQYPLKLLYAGTTHRLQGETVSLEGRLLVDVTYPAFLHGQAYVTFSRARSETQIYAVCRDDGQFTSLTFTRMLGNPLDSLLSEVSAGVLPRTIVEEQSSDSDRDDPFAGSGADWFAEHTGSSFNLRKTKRLGEEEN